MPEQPWEVPQNDIASRTDIFFCFKLILGRSPNKEEWAGHSSRAGEPLKEVVRTYLNSAEFKARNLLASQMPASIVKKHNGRFVVFADVNDPVIGAPVANGTYEPNVTQVVEQLLKPGDTFLDIGANIGYFTLLSALLVGETGRVYAIEPNDMNVKLIESGLNANKFANVSVMQVGAAERIETLMLHSNVGNGTTSTVQDYDIFSGRTIPGLPIDILLAGREKPVNVIKIDVEGYEYRALRGGEQLLLRDKPFIIFEFAAKGIFGIGGAEFLRWLEGKGYTFADISTSPDIESDHSIDEIMNNFENAMVDHLDILAKPVKSIN